MEEKLLYQSTTNEVLSHFLYANVGSIKDSEFFNGIPLCLNNRTVHEHNGKFCLELSQTFKINNTSQFTV